MKATKIILAPGRDGAYFSPVIHKIWITGGLRNDFFSPQEVHDYLLSNPDTIQVGIPPYPSLIPISRDGKKYVRSALDHTAGDNLLNLPRA